MSQTLVFHVNHTPYYLARANARVTTSAVIARDDIISVAGVEFTVTGFRHKLGEGKIAPTTYIWLIAHPQTPLDEDAIMRLQLAGFERGEDA